MKWIKQPAALLLCLLLLTSVAMAGTGMALKYTKGKSSQLVQDTLAIAVPFLYLRGEVVLTDENPPKYISIGGLTEKGTPDTEMKDPEEFPSVEGTPGEDGPGGETPNEGSGPVEGGVVFCHVEEDYFDTALFIGDSRTEGLKLYGRLGQADYFANAGMSVFNLFEKTVSDHNFAEQDLRSLLSSKTYETIYLSLGINELGYPRASLEKKFSFVMEEIRALQPQAHLILLGNLSVTKEKSEKTDYLTVENVRAINELIASYADQEMIFYLDPNTYFSDAEGYLRTEVTGDGVHPYAKEYQNWAIWLKDYGLVARPEC